MQDPQRQENEKRKSPKILSVESSEVLAMWLLTFSQLYHQEIGELAVLAYKEALKKFNAEQIDRGCRAAIEVCTFIPKPKEIIDAIRDTAPSLYAELKTLPSPRMTSDEYKAVFAQARETLGHLLIPPEPKPDLPADGVVIITEEMRAEQKRKAAEAAAKFGKSR